MLVECGIEIDEIGEEAPCCDFAGEFVKVVVAVFGKIAHSALLFPYLNREDGSSAVAYTLVSRVEEFADNAATFGRSIRAVVDGTEDNLIAAAAVDCVHVVDKRFHRLMDAAYSAVDCVLQHAVVACQTVQRSLCVIIESSFFEVGQIFSGKVLQCFNLFDE